MRGARYSCTGWVHTCNLFSVRNLGEPLFRCEAAAVAAVTDLGEAMSTDLARRYAREPSCCVFAAAFSSQEARGSPAERYKDSDGPPTAAAAGAASETISLDFCRRSTRELWPLQQRTRHWSAACRRPVSGEVVKGSKKELRV